MVLSLRLPRVLTVAVLALLVVPGIQAFQKGGQFVSPPLRNLPLTLTRRWMDASTASSQPLVSTNNPMAATDSRISLKDYLEEQQSQGLLDEDLCHVLLGVATSCAQVSRRLQTHTLDYSQDNSQDNNSNSNSSSSSSNKNNNAVTTTVNVQGEVQKKMDVVANDIFLQTLHSVDSVAAMASEEEEAVIYSNAGIAGGGSSGGDSDDNHKSKHLYEIAFDPLDGSGNLEANLPTGSIFGIGVHQEEPFSKPGSELVAAGYALYSSSTELVMALGTTGPVVGFTLVDGSDFVVSRPSVACPPHGPYYSLNEAREPDWPQGLTRWMADAKRGRTSTGTAYSSRYVCSLCADFHRTLLQGGWAGNPRPHLRLLYEAAPLAFVCEAAGGKGIQGGLQLPTLLEILPQGLHDRVPVFLGSREDIEDLQGYGDIQQKQSKRYEA